MHTYSIQKAEAMARAQADKMKLAAKGAMPLDKLVDSVRSAAEQAGMGGEMPSLREYLDAFPRTASDGRRLTAAVRSLCSWSSWARSLTGA